MTAAEQVAIEMWKQGEFIELDFGGWRYSRFGAGVTIHEMTCLRRDYMREPQWHEKLLEFLKRQPSEMGIFACRFNYNHPGKFLGTVGEEIAKIERPKVELTAIEWETLRQFAKFKTGMYVRTEETKQATLSLTAKGFLCDPHTEGDALFTRITETGLAALES